MNDVYVRATRLECLQGNWRGTAEVRITRFDKSNFDAAMDFADQLYSTYKDKKLECGGETSPEWYVDAFLGSSESVVAQTVYKNGKRLAREKLVINRRTVYSNNDGTGTCNWNVLFLHEFPSDVLYDAIATARALAEQSSLISGTITCRSTSTSVVLFKDDIVVQMMRDGSYIGQTLFSVQQDKGKKSGIVKTNFDDTTPPDTSSPSDGLSIWQIIGAIGLAGAVGYGAWKVTGMIVDREPSRSFR